MKRYIALLRGINISGKNKLSMPELKSRLIELGYTHVLTYLNSGNVIFTAHENEESIFADEYLFQLLCGLADFLTDALGGSGRNHKNQIIVSVFVGCSPPIRRFAQ